LTDEDIGQIAQTYHNWRSTPHPNPLPQGEGVSSSPSGRSGDEGSKQEYQDIPGYCRSATLAEITKHDYGLTPGRYVGAAAIEDDGIPFETKMTEMSQTLYAQMEESAKLDDVIRKNLKELGYGA
jgi:type I restriction enzyme M protein